MNNQKTVRLIRNLPTMCEFTDTYGEPIDSDAYYEAVDIAISALEKQMPKKLQNIHRFRGREKCVGTCPTCGCVCCSDYGDYCGGCGQAIDWTEGE